MEGEVDGAWPETCFSRARPALCEPGRRAACQVYDGRRPLLRWLLLGCCVREWRGLLLLACWRGRLKRRLTMLLLLLLLRALVLQVGDVAQLRRGRLSCRSRATRWSSAMSTNASGEHTSKSACARQRGRLHGPRRTAVLHRARRLRWRAAKGYLW